MGMGTMGPGAGGGFQSEINVTPLVDVVLVLLIIFMVIVPLTLRGYDVAIPGEAVNAPPPDTENEPVEQIVLGIDLNGCAVTEPPAAEGLPADCVVRVNDDEVAVAELAPHLAEIFTPRGRHDRVLFLAAHDRMNYEAVMRIIDIARSGVADLRIGLVTERKA